MEFITVQTIVFNERELPQVEKTTKVTLSGQDYMFLVTEINELSWVKSPTEVGIMIKMKGVLGKKLSKAEQG